MSAYDNADSLIDDLIQSTKNAILHPKSSRLLRTMGRKRQALECYMFRLERKLGIRSESGRYDT